MALQWCSIYDIQVKQVTRLLHDFDIAANGSLYGLEIFSIVIYRVLLLPTFMSQWHDYSAGISYGVVVELLNKREVKAALRSFKVNI